MSEALTSWTDAEYGRVALALQYPLTPDVTLSYGMDVYMIAVRLRSQLPQLNAHSKGVVLRLADEVNAAESQLFATGATRANVREVGEIKLDPAGGVALQADMLNRRRAQLSLVLGIPINPVAGKTGGGINAVATC